MASSLYPLVPNIEAIQNSIPEAEMRMCEGRFQSKTALDRSVAEAFLKTLSNKFPSITANIEEERSLVSGSISSNKFYLRVAITAPSERLFPDAEKERERKLEDVRNALQKEDRSVVGERETKEVSSKEKNATSKIILGLDELELFPYFVNDCKAKRPVDWQIFIKPSRFYINFFEILYIPSKEFNPRRPCIKWNSLSFIKKDRGWLLFKDGWFLINVLKPGQETTVNIPFDLCYKNLKGLINAEYPLKS